MTQFWSGMRATQKYRARLPELRAMITYRLMCAGGNRSIYHYLPPLFTTTPETTKKQSDGSAFRLKGSLDC